MQTISSFVVGLALLTFAACGSKPSLDQMKESRDRLCACTDLDCVKKESKTFQSFKTELQKLSDKELESALEVTQEGLACEVNLIEKLVPAASRITSSLGQR